MEHDCLGSISPFNQLMLNCTDKRVLPHAFFLHDMRENEYIYTLVRNERHYSESLWYL